MTHNHKNSFQWEKNQFIQVFKLNWFMVDYLILPNIFTAFLSTLANKYYKLKQTAPKVCENKIKGKIILLISR